MPTLRRLAGALTVLAPLAAQEAAVVDPWAARAELAQRALAAQFWDESTALFATASPARPDAKDFHYWWQAHALDALVDAFERSGDRAYLDRATALWDGVKRRNHGVTIDYYDDMLWMGLALHRLQEHTGDATQQRDVRTLWADIRGGWNDEQGGGIAWRKSQRDYKNTPANAPAVILGVRLHRTGGDPDDLAFAERVHAWLAAHLVDPESGFVWDGKNRKGDGATDVNWAFTYNQGVWIGANLELHRATDDARHLAAATRTFDAMVARMTDADGVLTEHGKGDGGLFKGILVRYVGDLATVEAPVAARARAFVERQATTVWSRLDPGQAGAEAPLLFAADWRRAATAPVELSVQLSGVMLFEQRARLR